MTDWLKNDDLTPCANCGKPHRSGIIRVLDTNIAVVSHTALRQYAGLNLMVGALADAFSPTPGVVVLNEQPELKNRFLLCNECWCQPICIAELVEKLNMKKEATIG